MKSRDRFTSLLFEPGAVLTVKEFTRQIKSTLELAYPTVAIQGEVSNKHLHGSGHLYFTLKDADAQISCVMWRSRVGLLRFMPEDGMNVIVSGRLTLYEPRGVYQIDATSIKPVGVGELQIAFEKLRAKLEAEGLFDPSRKREIPKIPARIGIVTSPTGAALQDMLTIIGRRFPATEVILRPAQVQGAEAGRDIAQGIDDLNAVGGIDVIIVGRGGGSMEDLWAFNEEIVARAIARSAAPVISAVGHEVDYTIADYVADLRAPTPSAAAELVVPDSRHILEQVANSWYTVKESTEALIAGHRLHIFHLLSSYAFSRPEDMLHQHTQHLDRIQKSLSMLASHTLTLTSSRLRAAQQRLEALNPALPMERGFALVRKAGTLIRSSAVLQTNDNVSLEFIDGKRKATIN